MNGVAQGLDWILLLSVSVFYFVFLSILQDILFGSKIEPYLNVKSLNTLSSTLIRMWSCRMIIMVRNCCDSTQQAEARETLRHERPI